MKRICFAAAMLAMLAGAQPNPSWERPFPAHKISGNLHYVGTEDLACFLITTPEGHILVNTGLKNSVRHIRAGIERLGFRYTDVKILLTMQAHFDHVAGFAEIQKATGAEVFATVPDAPVLEDGGKSDPYLGPEYRFEPVKVARRLNDGDVVELGGTVLKVHLTPGHTRGSVSYSMKVVENGKSYDVLLANMATVVMPLSGNPKYPNIVSDFERTFEVQKGLSPDIWVAAHASQYGMEEKFRKGSSVDPEGYRRAVDKHEAMFRERLSQSMKK
jgi:metallo-beta-lactamase class B